MKNENDGAVQWKKFYKNIFFLIIASLLLAAVLVITIKISSSSKKGKIQAAFLDNKSLEIVIPQDSLGFTSEPIRFVGKLKRSGISIDNNKLSAWIIPSIRRESSEIVLLIKEIPASFSEETFNMLLVGGAKKQITLLLQREGPGDIVDQGNEDRGTGEEAPIPWLEPKGSIINAQLEDLSDPSLFTLDDSGRVYGLIPQSDYAPPKKTLLLVMKKRVEDRSPACVYNFSEEDPVGELHALWKLGGRFLFKDDDGKTWKLGDNNSELGAEIIKAKQEAASEWVLSTNETGRKLLDNYCALLNVPLGSISLILPDELWYAVYQTLNKIYNDVDIRSRKTIYKSGTEVGWSLRSHAGGSYAIIIQKQDVTEK